MLFEYHKFGASCAKDFPTEAAARAYLAKINNGLVLNLWSMRHIDKSRQATPATIREGRNGIITKTKTANVEPSASKERQTQ